MSENNIPRKPKLSLPVHDARELVGPDGRAALTLDGDIYLLRITQTGKLILTK